jgi:phage replication initiation protein
MRLGARKSNLGGSARDANDHGRTSGRVFWSSTSPDMGGHVRLPGGALKMLQRDPVATLCDFRDMQGKFTRIDVAADDFEGLLILELIRSKLIAKEFVSYARNVTEVKALQGIGHTLYFGSRESESFMRIYDKRAEQTNAGIELKFEGPWVRVEMEFKHKRADAVGAYIYSHRDAWGIEAAGWFRNFLEFKERGADSNVSHWLPSSWWLDFLERASKARIVVASEERTLEDVKDWVQKQVAPSLFVLAATIGHDELFEIVGDGSGRLSERQVNMIEAYNKMLAQMNRSSDRSD